MDYDYYFANDKSTVNYEIVTLIQLFNCNFFTFYSNYSMRGFAKACNFFFTHS